jgi:hypothetical protein
LGPSKGKKGTAIELEEVSMSIQTQAILPATRNATELLGALRPRAVGEITLRPMHAAEYEIVEFRTPDGHAALIHVFGPSYVQEDYPDQFQDPSVLLSAEFTPALADLFRDLAKMGGGTFRRTDIESWTAS